MHAFPVMVVIGIKPLTVSEIFSGECNPMVNITLIRPLNKGQGHSFCYQSISHARLRVLVGCQWYYGVFSHNAYVPDRRRQTDATL